METILNSVITVAAVIIIIVLIMKLRKAKNLTFLEIEKSKKIEDEKYSLEKRIDSLLLLDTVLSSNEKITVDNHCGCLFQAEWGHCSGYKKYKYREGVCIYVEKKGWKYLSADSNGITVGEILFRNGISLKSIESINLSKVITGSLEEVDCLGNVVSVGL